MTYRERRFARLFQNPGTPAETVLKIGASGPGCRNIRRALKSLGFALAESDEYDAQVSQCIQELQARESHTSIDGLTGPGTRGLIVKVLMRQGGERVFNHFDMQSGNLFPTVFVSYAREDRRAVEQIVDLLLKHGVKVWVDYKDLRPGEKWEQAIDRAIPAARYFLAMLSRFTLSKKGFVQKEVKTAWTVAERYPDADIYVIPARLEDCEVHETKFSGLNYIDLFPDPSEGVGRLVNFLAEGD